jgi:hypothetical protein
MLGLSMVTLTLAIEVPPVDSTEKREIIRWKVGTA